MPSTCGRAEPLPAEQRRAALVAATLELMMAQGADVSTRQIATAAGVAEGTIFRVFSSKDELLQAAVRRAFDPAPLVERLDAIAGSSLEARMIEAVEVLQAGLTRIFHLMDALQLSKPAQFHPDQQARRQAVFRALADVLEPHRDELRHAPLDAARQLWLLAFASTHPRLTDDQPLVATEIVSLLLDGIRRPC